MFIFEDQKNRSFVSVRCLEGQSSFYIRASMTISSFAQILLRVGDERLVILTYDVRHVPVKMIVTFGNRHFDEKPKLLCI